MLSFFSMETYVVDIQKNGFNTRADPGFLEKGVIFKKVWGFPLLVFSLFSKYPMKMK